MKKILITATELHIVQFWIYHIEHLIKDGYEVDLVCSVVGDKYESLKEELSKIGGVKVTVVNLQRSPLSPDNLNGYFQLSSYLKTNDYDVIITNEPVMGLMTRLASRKQRRKGTKIIYFAHGFHFWKGAPKLNWLLFCPIEKFASQFTDTIVTMNSEDYNFAKEHFKTDIKYTYGIGVDLSKFAFDEKTRIEKREELGVSDKDFVIFTVSELTDRKNLFLALKAVKGVVNNGYDVKYFIRGKGPLEEDYQKYINDNALSDNVFLLGYGKDIPQMCCAADVFLFTSKQEGLPVCLLEAMSCNLPCVVSDIRGSNDLIKNGKGGYLCPLDNPDEFSKRIIEVINSENKEELTKDNKKTLEPYSKASVYSFIKQSIEENLENTNA